MGCSPCGRKQSDAAEHRREAALRGQVPLPSSSLQGASLSRRATVRPSHPCSWLLGLWPGGRVGGSEAEISAFRIADLSAHPGGFSGLLSHFGSPAVCSAEPSEGWWVLAACLKEELRPWVASGHRVLAVWTCQGLSNCSALPLFWGKVVKYRLMLFHAHPIPRRGTVGRIRASG